MPLFLDLSHPLNEHVHAYPGDPVYACRPSLTIVNDGCNVLSLSLGSHTGTHVDAPYHFFSDGLKINEIPLSTFVRLAIVVDLTHLSARAEITPSDLSHIIAHLPQGDKPMLLLHTGWSSRWGTPGYHDHPYLGADAARAIVSAGFPLVGIDAFSPDLTTPAPDAPGVGDSSLIEYGGAEGFEAHRILLGAGVVIAENLRNLRAIQGPPEDGGQWMVHIVPLAIENGDGSPVRAYAIG